MYAPELIYTIIMIKSLSLSIQDLLQNDHSFIVKIIIWLKITYVIEKNGEDVYVFFINHTDENISLQNYHHF